MLDVLASLMVHLPSFPAVTTQPKQGECGTAKEQDAGEPFAARVEAAMAAEEQALSAGSSAQLRLSSSMWWSGSGFVWFKLFLFSRLRLLPRS